MALIDAKRGRKKPPSLKVKFDGNAPVDLKHLVVISNGLFEKAKVLRTLPLLKKDPAKSGASSQPRSNSVTAASFLPAADNDDARQIEGGCLVRASRRSSR